MSEFEEAGETAFARVARSRRSRADLLLLDREVEVDIRAVGGREVDADVLEQREPADVLLRALQRRTPELVALVNVDLAPDDVLARPLLPRMFTRRIRDGSPRSHERQVHDQSRTVSFGSTFR